MNRAALAAILLATLFAGCTKDPDPSPEDRLVWPFPEAVVPAGGDATLLVLWDQSAEAPGGIDWVETRLGDDAMGFATLGPGETLGTFVSLPPADPDAPRFGVGGHNATQITLMVFNDEAELLATTAGLHEYAHLPWIHDRLYEIEDATYYLGDGDAPNGTKPLPAFLEPFRPRIVELLHGLSTSGVSSVVVPEQEYRDAFGGNGIGDLYLTARVDGLVQAP